MINEQTLQLAKAYENKTHTKRIMVENFGNQEQINRFNKDNGWKDTKRELPFLRTLNQYFESVESVKVKGVRAKQYKLGAARKEVAERESDNTTNGDWKQSTRHLDALILSHLENDIENHVEIEKSVVGWMYEFNLINQKAYDLHLSRFNTKLKEQVQDDIKKLVSAEDSRVVNESYRFIQNDIRNQKDTLMSALNRMTKHHILETFDRPKAMRVDEKTGLPVNKIDVDMKVYKYFTDTKRELRQKLEITDEQINNYVYEKPEIKEKIDEYNKKLKEALREVEVTDAFNNKSVIAISHVWLDLAIIVKATQKKTMDYLHRFHAEILKEYQQYKEEKYLSGQAAGYKSKRTEERLRLAEKKKDRNIEYKKLDDKKEQSDWVFGKSIFAPDYHEQQARLSKETFMRAIEILDKVYADKFIIDEEKIAKSLSKTK